MIEDKAPAASPYVDGAYNASKSHGKSQGGNTGRHRKETKVLIAAEWQGLDGFFEAESLRAAGLSAPGPPRARLMGRSQLDRETPTDTTTCKGAVAAYQTLSEIRQLDACNLARSEALARLRAGGEAELAQQFAAAAFKRKRYAYEEYDGYLVLNREEGAPSWGLGMQHLVPTVKQHWKQGQQERFCFTAQAGVVEKGQLASLCNGHRMWALAFDELPGASSAAAQPSILEEELPLLEEEEGLVAGQLTAEEVQDTGGQHGYYFSAANLPSSDNMVDHVMQLFRKAARLQPLPNTSSETGVPHPHCFRSADNRASATLLEAAANSLRSVLPPGYEVEPLAEEGRPAMLCVIPPEGTPLNDPSLNDALALTHTQVDMTQLLPIVELGLEGMDSEKCQLLLQLLCQPGSSGVSDVVPLLEEGVKVLEGWTIEDAVLRSPAAPSDAGAEEEGPSTSRNVGRSAGGGKGSRANYIVSFPTAAAPSGVKPPRFYWTPARLTDFDAAVDKLGGLDKAKPSTIKALMADPEVTTEHIKSHLQNERYKLLGFAGMKVPAPEVLPGAAQASWAAAAAAGGTRMPAPDASAAAAAAAAGSTRMPGPDASAAAVAGSTRMPAPDGSAAAAAAAVGGPLPATPAPARNRGGSISRAGLPPGTNDSHTSRMKGEAARPPVATTLLSFLRDERMPRVILVGVERTDRPFKLADRVAGFAVNYVSLGQLLARRSQAFYFATPEEVARNGSPAGGVLIHAAALPGTGALRSQSVNPSAFASEALQPGTAQKQALSKLLVSSASATAAALLRPRLVRLAFTAFAAAAHKSGVDLAGAGLVPRLEGADLASGAAGADSSGAAPASEQGSTGWVAHFAAACGDVAKASRLAAAAEALLRTGLVDVGALRNSIVHLREKLGAAGAEIKSAAAGSNPVTRQAALGLGDVKQGGIILDAIDAWKAGLEGLGAGPMPGLTAPSGGATWAEKVANWRGKVEVGWPGAAAFFETALAAGVELSQLASRWTNDGAKKGWEGKDPSPALKLKAHKKHKKARLA